MPIKSAIKPEDCKTSRNTIKESGMLFKSDATFFPCAKIPLSKNHSAHWSVMHMPKPLVVSFMLGDRLCLLQTCCKLKPVYGWISPKMDLVLQVPSACSRLQGWGAVWHGQQTWSDSIAHCCPSWVQAYDADLGGGWRWAPRCKT